VFVGTSTRQDSFISVNGDDGGDDLAEGTYRITQSPNSGKQHDISHLEEEWYLEMSYCIQLV